jgi:hypothetical protein
LDLTNKTSEALINPSTVTSSRKFIFVTGFPDCALVWLTSELFDHTIGISVPGQDAHWNGKVVGTHDVSDVQCNHNRLHIADASKVYGHLSSVDTNPKVAYAAGAIRHLGAVAGHGIGERDDHLMIASASAAAAFNANVASERKIDVEATGCSVRLSRNSVR